MAVSVLMRCNAPALADVVSLHRVTELIAQLCATPDIVCKDRLQK